MKQHRTMRISLSQGQALHRHARRGTIVVAASGAIRIVGAPLWLGEQVISEKFDVREGEAHVVQQTGWLAITALSAADVVCITDGVHGWPALIRWCEATGQSLRRRWQRIAPGAGRS